MKKLNITKGKWELITLRTNPFNNDSMYFISTNGNKTHSIKECEDNAELIADAGNTYQECELLPSELLSKLENIQQSLTELYYQVSAVKQDKNGNANINTMLILSELNKAIQNAKK